MALIAIGGGQPRRKIYLLPFTVMTWLSLRQAKRAGGCLHVRLFKRDGCFFSLSVWESPADMKRYASSGSHAYAMKAARWMVEWFKFHHFHHDPYVRVDDAYARWLTEHGHLVGRDKAA